MLREHKNELFETIKGFTDISIFESRETQRETFEIQLRNSPFIFMVRQKEDDFDSFTTNFTIYKPGLPLWKTPEQFDNDQSFYDFPLVIQQLFDWLRDAVRYLDEKNLPDFWTQLNTYSSFTTKSSIPEEELQQFSEGEKIQVKQYLLEFEERIVENFSPLQDQLQFINERLEYLSQSVDRLNRFDWKAQAMSILTSIAINLGVDTEGGRKLLQLFLQGFEFLTKHLPRGGERLDLSCLSLVERDKTKIPPISIVDFPIALFGVLELQTY